MCRKSYQLSAAMFNDENALFWEMVYIPFINIVNIKAFNA